MVFGLGCLHFRLFWLFSQRIWRHRGHSGRRAYLIIILERRSPSFLVKMEIQLDQICLKGALFLRVLCLGKIDFGILEHLLDVFLEVGLEFLGFGVLGFGGGFESKHFLDMVLLKVVFQFHCHFLVQGLVFIWGVLTVMLWKYRYRTLIQKTGFWTVRNRVINKWIHQLIQMQILIPLLSSPHHTPHKLTRKHLSRRRAHRLIVRTVLVWTRRVLVLLFEQTLFPLDVLVHEFAFGEGDVVGEDLGVVLVELKDLGQSNCRFT